MGPACGNRPDDERAYLLGHWRLLEKLTAALRTESSVLTAILYGSTARGDGDDTSDIDLFVILKSPTRTSARELSRRLQQGTGHDTSVTGTGTATKMQQPMTLP